ncbi:paired-like homeodomain transcription factor LEUTX [Liolophura sinensis]|uniref:paired-like homeodomain transcription factor LEUTX n=1 Tax=Liolophura sinensis TaxID=3198878 RepID=UPI003157FC70
MAPAIWWEEMGQSTGKIHDRLQADAIPPQIWFKNRRAKWRKQKREEEALKRPNFKDQEASSSVGSGVDTSRTLADPDNIDVCADEDTDNISVIDDDNNSAENDRSHIWTHDSSARLSVNNNSVDSTLKMPRQLEDSDSSCSPTSSP